MWNFLDRWWGRWQRIEDKLDYVIAKVDLMSVELDKLTAAVSAENNVISSAIVLLQGLATQIADLPAERTAIDALAQSVQAKSDELAAAVANTPTPTPNRR